MSTALVDAPVTAPVVTPDQVDLIKRTVAKDATPDELQLYFYDCARQGVHPLDKLIHFTKRKGKYVPVTSIDFFRLRAADSGEMAGSDDAVFVERGDGAPPSKATVTVYRLTHGHRFAYTGTARWSEYKPDEDWMWRRMPYTMLSKCAEALALRKAFPKQLAGLYVAEEMEQAGNVQLPALSASPSTPAPSTGGSSMDGGTPAPTGDDSAVIDQETGEVLPAAPPPGYHFVHDYKFTENGWHEATLLNFDGLGGGMRISTTADVGARLKEAQDQGVPVKVQITPKKTGAKGEAYLVNKFGVRFYDPSLEDLPF